MSNISAAIITIGDELLIGQVIDTNSAWMAQRLNVLGIDVLRRVAVGDEAAAIKKALDEEIERADIILLTGGLGPTADDITKPLLCDYFGGKMVVDEAVLKHVQALFTKRNRPFLDRNLKQAEVPDNCTVLNNSIGTAPGMWFEKNGKVIISLPGVPFEMTDIMDKEVLPRLSARFISDALLHESIITVGEGESFIAEQIKDLEETLPSHIKLAYLPAPGMVRLRLTGRGADTQNIALELKKWQQDIAQRLEKITVALEDKSLEYILGKALSDKGVSIGLAESCTAGYISHLLTQTPGASAYFKGSVVCYDTAVKQQILGVKKETLDKYKPVSEEVAIEMAQATLKVLNCDYSLSVTGLLGPDGDDSEVPVGTVWIAVASKETVKTRSFTFHYDRRRNKELAAQMALLMAWKFLHNRS